MYANCVYEGIPMASGNVERAVRDSRLNLRATARQDTLIRRAALATDKSVTDFVLDSATMEAERVLADRRWFTLDESAWQEFQSLLDAPAAELPGLAELMNRPTVFDSVDG